MISGLWKNWSRLMKTGPQTTHRPIKTGLYQSGLVKGIFGPVWDRSWSWLSPIWVEKLDWTGLLNTTLTPLLLSYHLPLPHPLSATRRLHVRLSAQIILWPVLNSVGLLLAPPYLLPLPLLLAPPYMLSLPLLQAPPHLLSLPLLLAPLLPPHLLLSLPLLLLRPYLSRIYCIAFPNICLLGYKILSLSLLLQNMAVLLLLCLVLLL